MFKRQYAVFKYRNKCGKRIVGNPKYMSLGLRKYVTFTIEVYIGRIPVRHKLKAYIPS